MKLYYQLSSPILRYERKNISIWHESNCIKLKILFLVEMLILILLCLDFPYPLNTRQMFMNYQIKMYKY